MPGRSSQSWPVIAFAALVAVIAVVGTLALGWEWGRSDPVPTAIGVAVALIAVAWTLYARFA